MRWLDELIELDTNSTLYAIFIFSTISVICSVLIILIYVKNKALRTFIYHFFFHSAINECLSRLSYLLLFIIDSQYNITCFRICSFLIYLTDTNILILVSFACLGMYLLILKQNTKISEKFHIISIFLYIFSLIMTTIFFIISNYDEQGQRDGIPCDPNLYRNIITLFFIQEDDLQGPESLIFTTIFYWILVIFSLVMIILIQIFIKDRATLPSGETGEDEENEDKTTKSSLKLRSFRIKLFSYPLLNLAYVIPIQILAWIEFSFLSDKDHNIENMSFLRTRYAFYNIYCFMNSIRGWLFFKVFILNEKIKKLLFDKYLNFEIFKTIDKINEYDELLNNRSSNVIESTNLTKFEKNISLNDDINSNKKINKDDNSNKKTDKDDTNKNKTKLINDDDEESDEDDDE